jgi:hypothetical protein
MSALQATLLATVSKFLHALQLERSVPIPVALRPAVRCDMLGTRRCAVTFNSALQLVSIVGSILIVSGPVDMLGGGRMCDRWPWVRLPELRHVHNRQPGRYRVLRAARRVMSRLPNESGPESGTSQS